MGEPKMCVLYDRVCIGCGECDRCDLDPEKICDNCMTHIVDVEKLEIIIKNSEKQTF